MDGAGLRDQYRWLKWAAIGAAVMVILATALVIWFAAVVSVAQ